MLYLDRVLLTRRTVQRQFPTIKGWTTEKLRERVREERKANQPAGTEAPKGFKREEWSLQYKYPRKCMLTHL